MDEPDDRSHSRQRLSSATAPNATVRGVKGSARRLRGTVDAGVIAALDVMRSARVARVAAMSACGVKTVRGTLACATGRSRPPLGLLALRGAVVRIRETDNSGSSLTAPAAIIVE